MTIATSNAVLSADTNTATPKQPRFSSLHTDRRMRQIVQRLVIDLGYLEHVKAEAQEDTVPPGLTTAISAMNTAIDYLNGISPGQSEESLEES